MSRRIMHAAAIAAVTLTASLAGAQGVKQQGSATAAKAAVNHVWDELITAMKAGDATVVVKAYTPDAIMIDPGMATISGRANIESTMKGWLASTKFLGMTRQQTAFESYGDIAIENGTFVLDLQEKGKAPSKNAGRYTMVWKQVDGRWLIHRDVSTPMPHAPTTK